MQHAGCNTGRIAVVYKGEVAKEEVHGCLEVGIGPDQHDHAQVSCQSDEVDSQKQHTEDLPQHGVVCDSHESEIHHGSVV